MEEKIETVSIGSPNYPRLLKKIKNPPEILYYRGSLVRDESRTFAIVGTRRCSDYGKQIALEIAGDLAEAGLTIVSGTAPGIDTFAHEACVERKKRTIAVLGTGIDAKTIYPQSNLKLADRILEAGGCIMSEYVPGFHGSKITFPERNRIISGISLGVLVVEAKQKSGSLITADLARKQGKKLFAVPGSVHSPNSWGTNFLIKKGRAKLVGGAEDILKELGLVKKSMKEKVSGENPEENLILETLKEGSQDVNKIIIKTKLPASRVATSLAILEIKDKVRNLGGNVFSLKS